MNDLPDRSARSRQLWAIARRFRRDSLAVHIPLRERLLYWFFYLGLARHGTQVPSPTHDTQYADGFYQRGYQRACNRINRRLSRATARPPVEVPSFDHGSVDLADLQQLMRLSIPFVIRNGAQGLPIRNWTLDYLEAAAGTCAVPINEAADRPADDTSRPTKSHHYYAFRTGTLAEVVRSIRSGGAMRITTAEDVMHHDEGRLRRDLDLPYWERVSGWAQGQRHWLRSRLFVGKIVGAQLLMQPQGAFTLWHAEPGDNFFVLAKGHKNWTLAHPYYTAALRPRVKTTTNYHGSNVDVREPDDVQRRRGFDGYPAMPKVQVRLQPGDVLRVPNHWWHTVVTDVGDYTLAATIRSNSPPNRTGFAYGILRLLDSKYHAMAKAYLAEGRIHDHHIGYPRKSRVADDAPAPRQPTQSSPPAHDTTAPPAAPRPR